MYSFMCYLEHIAHYQVKNKTQSEQTLASTHTHAQTDRQADRQIETHTYTHTHTRAHARAHARKHGRRERERERESQYDSLKRLDFKDDLKDVSVLDDQNTGTECKKKEKKKMQPNESGN